MLRFLLLLKFQKKQKKNLKSPDGINIQKIHFLFGVLLFSATFVHSALNTGTLLSVAFVHTFAMYIAFGLHRLCGSVA